MNLVSKNFYRTGMPSGVIHVGGYDGNEQKWYHAWGTKSVWFEPLPDKFQELKSKGLNAYQFALGSKEGKAKFNLSKSLQCCSILEPSGHLEKYPEFSFEGSIDVEVKTLDSFEFKDYDMLVLDVQGYEMEVLKGAIETLKHIKIIYCEVAIIELYKNAPLFSDIYKFLPEFELVDIDWVDGVKQGWGDALFIRK